MLARGPQGGSSQKMAAVTAYTTMKQCASELKATSEISPSEREQILREPTGLPSAG